MKKGFSFAEMLVVTVILSVITLSLSRIFGVLNKAHLERKTIQMLRNEALQILNTVSRDVQQTGLGLSIVDGKKLIDEIPSTDYPYFLFYYEDADNDGQMSDEDRWVKFYRKDKNLIRAVYKGRELAALDLISGPERINNTAVDVTDMVFHLYSSRDVRISDADAVSSVVINIELTMGNISNRFSKKVLLENIIYGQIGL